MSALFGSTIGLLIKKLLTGDTLENARLKVDVAQTGFWEGREFRLEREIAGPTVIKFVSPINFILQLQAFASHDGEATLAVYSAAQGAEGGTFTALTQNPNNAMSTTPSYTPQITLSTGGTFTPSSSDPNFAREFVRVVSASATAQQSTVGGSGIKERGLGANTYYLVFTGLKASYRLIYEERP